MTIRGSGNKARAILVFAGLFLLLILLVLINIRAGSVAITAPQILAILFGDESAADATLYTIIWQIRLPRICSAAILGGALAVSGYLLQTFFRNPIAGPFVLGISSGAKLVVAFVMIWCLGRNIPVSAAGMIGAAFLGSMISMGLVLVFSMKVRSMSMLVVCGVMISYICSAATDFAVTFADDSNIVNLHNWSLGSFSGSTWSNVGIAAAVTLAAMVCVFLLSKPMSAWQLGEAYAVNLGVRIPLFKAALILLSSILSACVTAFAGPISFVGIAVPHLVKRALGTAKPILMTPACFLGGAVFCLFSDLAARSLFSPTELSISSVTAIFGAPVVILMMVRGRRGGMRG